MHTITELPAWERLLKRIVWAQLGTIQGKHILDFGSGKGITANYLAEKNHVVAIEPSEEMLDGKNSAASQFGAIRYYEKEQIAEWEAGLSCMDCFGIRTFWDLQQNQEKHASEEWQEKMMQLEMRVSQMEEYRRIAFFHHLLFVKRST